MRPMFLYYSWQLVLFSRGVSTSPFISRGRGYKDGNWVGYNMISIMTLSLLAYFTYILIDIIIYALESMPWSYEIFWMMGRVIADPFLGLPSPCRVVPRVSILVSSPQVPGKWVDAGWFGSPLSLTNLPSTQFQKLSTLAWNCWVLFHRIDRIGVLYRCTY
jgi:hypothetical protein